MHWIIYRQNKIERKYMMSCSKQFKSKGVQDILKNYWIKFRDAYIEQNGSLGKESYAEFAKGFKKGYMKSCNKRMTQAKKQSKKSSTKRRTRRI